MEEQIEVLSTAYEYLDKLTQGTLQAAQNLYSGQEYKGFQSISLIADGISWLIQVFELTRQVQKEEIRTEGIVEIIDEINVALQKKDTVSIADLLEYEVIPILKKWQLSLQKSFKLN